MKKIIPKNKPSTERDKLLKELKIKLKYAEQENNPIKAAELGALIIELEKGLN